MPLPLRSTHWFSSARPTCVTPPGPRWPTQTLPSSATVVRETRCSSASSEIVRYSPRIAPVSVLIFAIVQRCESATQMNGNVPVVVLS